MGRLLSLLAGEIDVGGKNTTQLYRRMSLEMSHVVSGTARDCVLFGWKNVTGYVSEIHCGNIGVSNRDCQCSQWFEGERHMEAVVVLNQQREKTSDRTTSPITTCMVIITTQL